VTSICYARFVNHRAIKGEAGDSVRCGGGPRLREPRGNCGCTAR
jgi:hypothetical protein